MMLCFYCDHGNHPLCLNSDWTIVAFCDCEQEECKRRRADRPESATSPAESQAS